MSADEASYVREQYATPRNLRARKAAYVNAEGDDPRDFVLEAVAAAKPRRVLEVGGGEGELAERIVRELDVELVGIDQSEGMVAEQLARGISARVSDLQHLPFDDGFGRAPARALGARAACDPRQPVQLSKRQRRGGAAASFCSRRTATPSARC